jgi:lysophospholipase L1-like esterase
MKPRDRAVGLSLSLVSLALLFGLLETGVRLAGSRPAAQPFRRLDVWNNGAFRPVDVWGTARIKRLSSVGIRAGEYVPGVRSRFVYPGNPRGYFDADNAVENLVNRWGLRGPEFAWQKPPGTFRILGLGDSYTFGEGVRVEDTFLARLAASLNGGGPARVEAINAGVSSYNTVDEVDSLELRWAGLRPDLVLITFVLNDAYKESLFGPLQMGYVDGLVRLARKPTVAGSRLLGILWDRLLRWRTARQMRRAYLAPFAETALAAGNSWESCRTALQKAARLSRQGNFRLALAIFPELYRLDDGYPFGTVHQQVRREAEALGIPVLDLFDAFRGRDARELWVHPADHHPNDEAHRIAAEALLEFLRDPRHALLMPSVRTRP